MVLLGDRGIKCKCKKVTVQKNAKIGGDPWALGGRGPQVQVQKGYHSQKVYF